MIFSENRYPLFGIMLVSTSSPPRQPLISRAARGRRYGRAVPNLQIFQAKAGWRVRQRGAANRVHLSALGRGRESTGPARSGRPDERASTASSPIRSESLRQFGNELGVFGFGPSPHGTGADVAHRADRHAELGDVVAAHRFDDADEIGVAVCQIGLLDLDPHLLGNFACGGGALGRVLDVTDTLFGPIHGDDEGRHGRLLTLPDKRNRTGATTPALLNPNAPRISLTAIAAVDFSAARAP